MPAKQPTKKTYSTDWQNRKATKTAVSRFEEQFKKDMGIDLAVTHDDFTVTSFGSMNIDYAVTIGGVPSGRIIEIWGPEHAGKTTVCYLMVAEQQRLRPDKKCAWVDMEQTFDPKYATALGVDVPALWRPPVKTAEDTADATKRFVESGLCSLVVLDSVGGMIAKMEMQKEADEPTVGLVAKIVTRMVKQVSPMAKSNDTTICVVNQVRAVIGNAFGPDETTAGGWALKHVTSIRLRVRRGASHTVVRNGVEVPVGHEMIVQVQKNKMGPFGQVARVWLHNVATDKYGPMGVDTAKEIFDLSKMFGLFGERVSKGGYYEFPDASEAHGEPAAVQVLRDRPDLQEILRGRIMATLDGVVHDETEEGSEAEGDFTMAMREK